MSQPPIWVSIHAPVKGATDRALDGGRHVDCFNPRSREGSDLQAGKVAIDQIAGFNPRSREGSDSMQFHF